MNKKDFLKIINLYSEAISFIGPGAAAISQMGSFGLRYVFTHGGLELGLVQDLHDLSDSFKCVKEFLCL